MTNKNNKVMKANEAPEKIYMTPSFGEPDNVLLASFSKSHLNFHRDIEYTRTDAFIEKACEFISLNVADYIDVTHKGGIERLALRERFIEKFIKHMKGE